MVAIATADKEGAAEGSHSLSLALAAGLLNCWKGDSCVGAARARSDWCTRMAKLVEGLGSRQLTRPRPGVGAHAPRAVGVGDSEVGAARARTGARSCRLR